jgi:outer membrane protein assembly factor BamE
MITPAILSKGNAFEQPFKKLKSILAIVISTSFCLFTVSCSFLTPYTPEIEQGKPLKKSKFEKLKPDMPAKQVRFILGSPDTVGTFDPNIWYYIHTYKEDLNAPIRIQTMTLIFENGQLQKVKGDYDIRLTNKPSSES